MPLLEIRGLCKSYSNHRVVDGIDFHVGEGEIVGLLGPNGAGKTTTFRIVMGIIRAEAGSVRLMNENITRLPMYRRAQHGMGYLSQEPSIFRNLTVEDNVMSILETQNLSRPARRARLAELLGDMNLTRLSRNLAHTLSGGERRRLEICRALVANPGILLLDEPFSGVDPKSCEDIQKIIFSLHERGIAILITDHNVFETFTIVDRAYIIRSGKVLKHGTPQELVEDPDARRLYLGDKFAEYGEAFRHLREEVRKRFRNTPVIRAAGPATQLIRREEEEARNAASARKNG
ncbi:MAG: LPS export ABC transporter ATP-binding protein [Planctomycetota bacterium]|jgi:lipopolysaccharide export system ATP-binding protein|nr:LPS export ABC transporter ATP-binding protein [Planctomycetota bacterium]